MTSFDNEEQPLRSTMPARRRIPAAFRPSDGVGDSGPSNLGPDDLTQLSILQGVSDESISGLLEPCSIHEIDEGEVLLAKGRPNQTMFLILSGELNVYLDDPGGEEMTRLISGQTVGELSVIDASAASAHVIAACPSRLLVIDETTFWRLVGASHEFCTNLLLMLTQRVRANNVALSRSVKLRHRFEHDALVDALTGLRNRRWLAETLPRVVDRHRDGEPPLALLMADIDHFKRFNDEWGHLAGDEVLAAVSRTLMTRLRPTDLACRYGGEELVVILPGTPLDGALVAAERLRRAIAETIVTTAGDQSLPAVTISIGAAQHEVGEGATQLLARADEALYRAKAKGRNRVES